MPPSSAGPRALGIVRYLDLEHRVGAGRQCVDRAFGDDSPTVDHDGPLAEVLDEVQLV